jgi:hypothetical protein
MLQEVTFRVWFLFLSLLLSWVNVRVPVCQHHYLCNICYCHPWCQLRHWFAFCDLASPPYF